MRGIIHTWRPKFRGRLVRIRVRNAMDVIPSLHNEVNRYWNQPSRRFIFISENRAYMSRGTFNGLAEYSRSVPTGVYAGKMWRHTMKCGKRHFLQWFTINESDSKSFIHSREIVIT